MALQSDDRGRPKAAIPTIFQPPPGASGLLAQHFADVDAGVAQTDHKSRADERARYQLGLAAISDIADGRSVGFILPGPLVAIRNAREEQRKREQDRGDERRALSQLLDAIDATLAALKAELEAIDRRLDEIKDRRAKIGEALDAADDIMEIRRRGGKIDGRNPAHRKMLAALGITEAEANGDDYAAIIARRRGDLDREDAGLEVEQNAKLKRRDEIMIEQAGALAARSEIETANTDEARILAARRASSVVGVQQLGEAAYWSSSKDAKQVAAEAVVAQEPAAARPNSETLAHESITDKQTLFGSSANTFTP